MHASNHSLRYGQNTPFPLMCQLYKFTEGSRIPQFIIAWMRNAATLDKLESWPRCFSPAERPLESCCWRCHCLVVMAEENKACSPATRSLDADSRRFTTFHSFTTLWGVNGEFMASAICTPLYLSINEPLIRSLFSGTGLWERHFSHCFVAHLTLQMC